MIEVARAPFDDLIRQLDDCPKACDGERDGERRGEFHIAPPPSAGRFKTIAHCRGTTRRREHGFRPRA